MAMVQGQAQAAQATVEFIERVGFVSGGEPGALGDLRTGKFSYQRTTEDGELQTFEVGVPLLSLVPVPSIQIREAEIEFWVKVTDIQSQALSSKINEAAQAPQGDWLSTTVPQLRTALGSTNTGQRSQELQMHVKLKLEQADVPAGLAHLFNILEQGITSQPASEKTG